MILSICAFGVMMLLVLIVITDAKDKSVKDMVVAALGEDMKSYYEAKKRYERLDRYEYIVAVVVVIAFMVVAYKIRTVSVV